MPTLLKLEKPKRINSEKRLERQKIYNCAKWRNLRNGYFILHPLCEVCLEKGITKPADDVHHIISPFHQDDKKLYAYDSKNLICLCKDCHAYIHANKLESTLYHIYDERRNI